MDRFIIGLILVLAVLIIAALAVAAKRSHARMLENLNSQFGQLPDNEELEFNSISRPWKTCTDKEPYQVIDDITWDDLDMNRVFAVLDACQTSIGEEYLYTLLHKFADDTETSRCEELMELLDKNPELRLRLQVLLKKAGKTNYNGLAEFIESSEVHGLRHTRVYKLFAFLPLLSIVLIPFSRTIGTACVLCFLACNLVLYYRAKKKTEFELPSVRYLANILTCGRKICKIQDAAFSPFQTELQENLSKLRKLGGATSAVLPKLYKSDMDVITEFYSILTLHEIRSYNKMIQIVTAQREACKSACRIIAQMDTAIAILSFRKSLPVTCKPHYIKSSQVNLQEIYHPLLQKPVSNSILFEGDSLITGSNASGKSTFIKAVAVNGILARAINTCTARVYQAPKTLIITSMAVRDNILSGESYFIAEIKSLKRVLEHMAHTPCLCFVDEILKGTNTVERIAASSAVLRHIHELDGLCLVATHDMELTQILAAEYENYHFSEQITDDGITFDYLIKPGPSNTTNAVKLLDYMGFDKAVVQSAETGVREFLQTGKWGTAQR